MDISAKLALPYLLPQQAQKHVTHNEAIRMLDALVHLSIKARDESDPPATPAEGDRYALSDTPTGDWSGNANQIAAFQDGAWAFFNPQIGWIAWNEDTEETLVWDGTDWQPAVPVPSTLSGLTGVGVNTAPDIANKLAVKSDAILLSHDDVTPGSGDMRQVLNKAAASNTASMLFQTGFSGRAEFGLTGDDDWHVKVSPDGSNWQEALVADKDDGQVHFPNGILHPASGRRAQAFVGFPSAPAVFRIDSLHGQNPRTATIAVVSSDIITISSATADHFFTHHMEGKSLARIWNISKSPEESAWVKYSDEDGGSNTQLQVSNAADISTWLPGDTIQIGDPSAITPNRCSCYDISPAMTADFGAPFRQAGIIAKYYISGDTGVLGSLDTVGTGITPTGISGTFNNAGSNNQGVASQGILYIPCSLQSPVSNSNLIFVRENGAADTITISLISILGLLVEV